LNGDQLQIRLPTTVTEWEEVRRGFESKSLGGVINGCVGAIDGFFQRTLMPTKKDCTNNQTAYFSEHYKHYGANCLGICDVGGRYLFFVSLHQEKQTTHCRLSTLDVTKF